jgi:hypothetical protein
VEIRDLNPPPYRAVSQTLTSVLAVQLYASASGSHISHDAQTIKVDMLYNEI